MAERKTATSHDKESGISGWIEFAKESFVEHTEGVLHGLLGTVERGVEGIVKRTMRSFSIFFFVLLGSAFLLIGIAQILDQAYQFPGVGKVIIGMAIFSLALLLSMVDHRSIK